MPAGVPGERTLVVLPTYNECETLAGVVTRLLTVCDADVLIIDDRSPDGTGAIADAIAAADPRVAVMHRPAKLGLGTAYVHGFEYALAQGYRWVVEMDSDGSHLPEQLPDLLTAASAGAALVIGSRWIDGGRIDGWAWHRRAISRTGTWVAQVLLRSRLRDITSGFRVLDSRELERLDMRRVTSHGYAFQVELAWTLERLGGAIAEVPITFVERSAGRSKMSIGIVFEALRQVIAWGWLLRFAPHRLPDARETPGH